MSAKFSVPQSYYNNLVSYHEKEKTFYKDDLTSIKDWKLNLLRFMRHYIPVPCVVFLSLIQKNKLIKCIFPNDKNI